MNTPIFKMQNQNQQELHWLNICFFLVTTATSFIAVPLYFYSEGINFFLLCSTLLSSSLTCLCITAGYHRLFAHYSYQASPLLRIFFLVFGSAAFQGSVLQWATDHRRHHRHVDTKQDPHNIQKGFFWAHMGWLLKLESVEIRSKFESDLMKDKLILLQHQYYVLIAGVVGFGLPLLVGALFGVPWGGLLFAGFLRVVLSQHTTFLINSLAHTLGKKTYSQKQTARDSIIMAFLAFGEGYHNFHHVFSSDYRNGVQWYHWDPTKWFIRFISWFGLASKLKKIPATEILKARLQVEQQILLQKGIGRERVISLKERIEEAQKAWKLLKEEYQNKKESFRIQFREQKTYFQKNSLRRMKHFRQMLHLKTELKLAKLEFKMLHAQWGTLKRAY